MLNISNFEWQQVDLDVEPTPRCAHQAVIVNKSILIFGGKNNQTKAIEHISLFDADLGQGFDDFRKTMTKQAMLQELESLGIVPPPIPNNLVRSRYFTMKFEPFSKYFFPSVRRRLSIV